MPAIARYIYNELPGSCHGSAEAVEAWLERGASLRANQTAETQTPQGAS
jgi:hypothetical protein